jgi:hypothetical protein
MCLIVIVCGDVCVSLYVCTIHSHAYHFMHKPWHHANAYTLSCIIVTEMPESEPTEPAEVVEHESGVEFVVEQKENEGKQLSINF